LLCLFLLINSGFESFMEEMKFIEQLALRRYSASGEPAHTACAGFARAVSRAASGTETLESNFASYNELGTGLRESTATKRNSLVYLRRDTSVSQIWSNRGSISDRSTIAPGSAASTVLRIILLKISTNIGLSKSR